MVVKEVNPYACGWFLREYDPVLIFLTRHPADIALSFRDRGWWETDGDQLQRWKEFGLRTARSWRAAIEHSDEYDQFLHVKYEDLCLNTEGVLEKIYAFCGREMSPSVRASVQELSSASVKDTDDPYNIHRNSRNQIDKWRNKLTDEEVASLRAGFESVPLPNAYRYEFDCQKAALKDERRRELG